jgi:hypothetical protein
VTAALAKAVMSLAISCLGESRREWALAMQGEFGAAIDAGKPLAFATGCLMAAWREMPKHEEGRFVLVNYSLALGLIIPMAALQFACAAGLSSLFSAKDGLYGVPALGTTQEPYLSWAYLAAQPTLLGLWLLLCILHLRLAWVLLEGDWSRVIRTGSLSAAVTATLVIFNGVMLVVDDRAILQAAVLPIELMAIVASARWHARLTRALARDASLVIF